jgi:hypothetical protein
MTSIVTANEAVNVVLKKKPIVTAPIIFTLICLAGRATFYLTEEWHKSGALIMTANE